MYLEVSLCMCVEGTGIECEGISMYIKVYIYEGVTVWVYMRYR